MPTCVLLLSTNVYGALDMLISVITATCKKGGTSPFTDEETEAQRKGNVLAQGHTVVSSIYPCIASQQQIPHYLRVILEYVSLTSWYDGDLCQ